MMKKYFLAAIFGAVLFLIGATSLPVSAQTDAPPTAPAYPCTAPPSVLSAGSGAIVQYECHAYDNLVAMNAKLQRSWQFAVGSAILNGLSYFTQRIAVDMADWVLTGFKGGGPAFYRKGWDGFLNDVAINSVNVMITDLAKSDFLQKELGLNICQPISLSLKLSLGVNLKRTVFPDDCGYNVLMRNFEQTYQSLDPDTLAKNLKESVQRDSDIKVQLFANQKFLNQFLKDKESWSLDRQEGEGFKLVTSLISNQIDTPAQVMQNNLLAGNPLRLYLENVGENNTVLAAKAFEAGLEQLPIFAAGAFINTLAVGLVDKMFNLFKSGPGEDGIDLLDVDGQASALSGGRRAGAITDIFTPNLISSEKVDLLFELTSCPTPRGTWGCSLDDGFAQALRTASESGAYTVARAAGLNNGGVTGQTFLHADWELIPESDAKENQDPGCFQRAYCSSNLAKLRFARIIPAGWELAANSPYNKKTNGKYVTLGEVIAGFNVCTDGHVGPTTPWCHLISPTWVLTAPSFRCEVRGYGDTLTSADTQFRSQECSDVTSCLQRNDKGECVGGYGSCLSERTVWRFGADACEEKYASCRTYVSRQDGASGGKQVSYVRNTIDYGQCNASNVGCLAYALWHLDGQADEWYMATSGGVRGRLLSGPRVYFDETVETCDASGDGCTKMLKVTPGQSSLNLINNGSFERVEDSTTSKLEAWDTDFLSFFGGFGYRRWTYATFTPSEGTPSVDGTQAIEFAGGQSQYLDQRVDVAPLRNYVVSGYARRGNGTGSSFVQLDVFLQKTALVTPDFPWPDGVATTNIPETSTNVIYRSVNCLPTAPGANNTLAAAGRTNLTTEWQRFSCEFSTTNDSHYALVAVQGSNVAVDAVQMEEASIATPFVDGIAAGLSQTHLKIAPGGPTGNEEIQGIRCTGDAATDPEACQNYARMCKQQDVGCQGYQEIGNSGGEIPATLNATDYCPNACVGYAEYRKQPSAFDLTESADVYLNDTADVTTAYFVPKTAGICSAQSAGCEEFTNLDAAVNGGEEKAYFTYARACEKPSDRSTTFFTWEGSDTTGYQLKTWSLVRDDATGGGPLILRKAGPDGRLKRAEECTEAAWRTGEDPDCRQFYNEAGTPFYRYFSQTVVSSPSCAAYRYNNSTPDDCTKTGGEYSGGTQSCTYNILAEQSNMCPQKDAGCRAYMGTTGQNRVTAFEEDFAEDTNASFTSGAGTTAALSNEALRVGDHSLRITSQGAGGGVVQFDLQTTTDGLYVLSFWAKTTQPKGRAVNTTVTIQVDGTPVGSIDLELDWKRYEIGPFVANGVPASQIRLLGFPNTSYTDEFRVERLQDMVYARKNSWVTPAVCDQTPQGAPLAQAMLGCREYRDRAGNIVDVYQFSHLCKFDAIGCSAFINTRNSESPYAESFPLQGQPAPGTTGKQWDLLYSGDVTVTRPADRFEYVIDEPSAHCDASQASCRAFGKPIFNQDGSVSSTETVYLKDDITKYVDGSGEPNMLCRPSELFCDKFVSGQTTSFFRDPAAIGDRTCEWQDRILLEAGTTPFGTTYPRGEYSGWFIHGTQTPCYPEKVSTGNTFISEFSGSLNYRGWTELCPAEQSECTEFRDPNDHTDKAHPSGRSYFFIDNDLLDRQSCNGKVDLLGGCVAFRDMTDSSLPISTKATYAYSQANNNNPVGPVNCDTDPLNAYCVNAGTCENVTCTLNGQPCSNFLGIDQLDLPGFRLPNMQASQTIAALRNHQQCNVDTDCTRTDTNGIIQVSGTCIKNNANTIVKVKLDRDCQTWLGCSSAETVYDPSQGKYVDLCTDLSVCDQAGGTSEKNFCGHYQDRRLWAEFPDILDEGLFFNGLLYSMRATGFGDPEYSGYSIPNHFQIADYVTKPVAYDLLMERSGAIRDKYIRDYRVVAKVPLAAFGSTSPSANRATFYTDPRYPYLHLCAHLWNGQVGYYLPSELVNGAGYCYFAIEAPYQSSLTDIALDPSAALHVDSINPQNIQNIANAFEQLAYPELSRILSEGFPRPECKAAPEQNSPFSNLFVKEWDTITYPPVPKTYAEGYQDVNYCEYGEDCACSYRKVNYGSQSKYYELFGSTPPAGVCQGGIRDGEECVPNLPADRPAASGQPDPDADPNDPEYSDDLHNTEAFQPPEQQRCPGGTCQEIKSVTLIRGMYGQCLQRDYSRIIGGSQEQNPCLIWNPTPVLFGQSDVYHYQPEAGYLPDANSGEYYCVAGALPPKSVTTDNGWVIPPGELTPKTFKFDEDYVSDGDCLFCDGNEARFIDGAKAKGGKMGLRCEKADDDEASGFTAGDLANVALGLPIFGTSDRWTEPSKGRWIATGRGAAHSYAEYFIGLNEGKWAEFLYDQPADSIEACSEDETSRACAAMNERNFASFTFSPITGGDNGAIGCGYSADWVSGVSVSDYDSNDELKKASKKWQADFNKDFTAVLGADSADYLRSQDGAELQKVPCFYSDSEADSGDGRCYYKFWELGYHAEGQSAFKMQWDGGFGGPRKFDADAIYYETSQATKPFFAIRAMFEDTNPADNAIEASDMSRDGASLSGPFRFVGFWVTATVPGTDSERAIYMAMTIGHADICREVAQVVAPDSRNATAFLDRIQESSGFSVPVLGYTFGSSNVPFGSAQHTQSIGRSPLYQTNGPVPGSGSRLRPSAWLSSGVEYAREGVETPTGNWAWLTNLFARVYRVYRWQDRAVSLTDWVCTAGPNFGKWCPNLEERLTDPDTTNEAYRLSRAYCGYAGTCNPNFIDVTQTQALCNGLSGVNAGLPCSGDERADSITGYHVCHNAPVRMVNGQLTPQYTACDLQNDEDLPDSQRWGQTGTSFYRLSNPSQHYNRTQAQEMGAMRCRDGAVRNPNGTLPTCSRVAEVSSECPVLVLGGQDSFCQQGHCSNGYQHAECTRDADCSFTWNEWWNNGTNFPMAYNTDAGGNRTFTSLNSFRPRIGTQATPNRPVNDTEYARLRFNSPFGTSIWWNDNNDAENTDGASPGKDIAGKSFEDPLARYVVATDPGSDVDLDMLDRFPGAYIAVDNVAPTNATNTNPTIGGSTVSDALNIYIPAHCERPPVNVATSTDPDLPYDVHRYRGPTWRPGICEGGIYEGASCNGRPNECGYPAGLTPSQENDLFLETQFYCQPATSDACIDASAPASAAGSGNLDTDNNLCTHNAGYFPRADVCGPNVSRQQCLTAYTHSVLSSVGTASALGLPPTDVTGGLYTPDYLARVNNDATRFSGFDQTYASYYVPRPPIIAAPDTSHACLSAGQCSIAKVNGFSFENQTEGAVSYVGGQAVGSIRFYAWAADNQGPLSDIWVDWGDGNMQEFHDAKMKNKKPFCGVSNQCALVPGLTCQSDNDCPPAAGKCVPTGFCKSRPTQSCTQDTDCQSGISKDTCVIRTTFGNTDDACEQNYFEYTHAYSCGVDARANLAVCGNQLRCSRNPSVVCSSSSDCAVGDSCIAGLAPPGGCFDSTNVACRFTPRVLVKDNWGWCTGECRVQNLGNGNLGAGFGVVNQMLFNNGGCYDATNVHRTEDPSLPLSLRFVPGNPASSQYVNACDVNQPVGVWRPWIVYPGALQLGVSP